jgi:MFS family permease
MLGHVRESLVPHGRDARTLAALHLADAVGKGVFLSSSAVYFVTVKGFSAVEVGLGFSIAGATGFVASLVLGILADRVGPVRMLAAMLGLQAVGFFLYPAVHGVAAFYVLIAAIGFVEFGGGPAFAAIVGALFPPSQRVGVRAVLRSVFNVGFSVGSVLTGLAILGGPARLLPLITGALLAVSALVTLRLPPVPAAPRDAGGTRMFSALRDVRFMSVAALSAPLALHAPALLVGLPLWIVTRTSAPPSLVSALLVGNTVIAILFQVRASRGASDVAGAALVARRAGLWLAAGCLVVALAARLNTVASVILICVAVLLLTLAELQQGASAWGLAHGLAPEHAQAEYFGAFNLYNVAQSVFGPALLVGLVGWAGAWGWVLVAVVGAAAGLLMPSVVAGRAPAGVASTAGASTAGASAGVGSAAGVSAVSAFGDVASTAGASTAGASAGVVSPAGAAVSSEV